MEGLLGETWEVGWEERRASPYRVVAARGWGAKCSLRSPSQPDLVSCSLHPALRVWGRSDETGRVRKEMGWVGAEGRAGR